MIRSIEIPEKNHVDRRDHVNILSMTIVFQNFICHKLNAVRCQVPVYRVGDVWASLVLASANQIQVHIHVTMQKWLLDWGKRPLTKLIAKEGK